MSNLILPTMTRDNLLKLIDQKRGKLTAYGTKIVPIAYATHAESQGDAVNVYHHMNLIASLTPNRVWMSNAGWHTVTTANRLHRIAIDNGLFVGVGIKNFRMELRPRDGSPARSFETPYTENIGANHA